MNNLQELIKCWENSPFPSTKISTYFSAYAELFAEYRNTECVFIETGILGGGSLFMWRNWFGPKARIIGIDLNPEALKWTSYGFEIYIGDQGDRQFWKEILNKVGKFDILLDDGGHQSFQQIVTAQEAINHSKTKSIVVIEDTHSSFMHDFKSHNQNTFLNYSKDSTDILTAKSADMYKNRMPLIKNDSVMDLFNFVYSIQFFTSIVAFKIDPSKTFTPQVIWNKREQTPSDFRYQGLNKADILWPDPFNAPTIITVNGGHS